VRVCVEKVALDLVFLRVHLLSLVNATPPTLRTRVVLVVLTWTKEQPGNHPKPVLFQRSGSFDRKVKGKVKQSHYRP
jgi:hypothetical protein